MSYFHEEDEVTVCDSHDTDTQLIWTFAFDYKEFWCPACGATYGMMGAGRNVKWNWRIHNQYVKDLKNSRKFLIACSTLEGKKPDEMPGKLREYYERGRKKWKYRL